MQAAISISENQLSSATLMRRLRYLADPGLRSRVTAATNKVETYNGFSQWPGFGNNCVFAHNALELMDVVRALVAEVWPITAGDRPGMPGRLISWPRGLLVSTPEDIPQG
ncbi:Tn3 family transposase [Nonomuraea sp. LP-02]|nr:Tn3 family transposase [Nonomuraea sp. LP-02]MED7931249.1 Tn3 family transposase [Nonomuraea sp. LP-02]